VKNNSKNSKIIKLIKKMFLKTAKYGVFSHHKLLKIRIRNHLKNTKFKKLIFFSQKISVEIIPLKINFKTFIITKTLPQSGQCFY